MSGARFGVWCTRARSALWGAPSAAWSKNMGGLETFDTLEEAEARAATYRANAPASLGYEARPMPDGATGGRTYG